MLNLPPSNRLALLFMVCYSSVGLAVLLATLPWIVKGILLGGVATASLRTCQRYAWRVLPESIVAIDCSAREYIVRQGGIKVADKLSIFFMGTELAYLVFTVGKRRDVCLLARRCFAPVQWSALHKQALLCDLAILPDDRE